MWSREGIKEPSARREKLADQSGNWSWGRLASIPRLIRAPIWLRQLDCNDHEQTNMGSLPDHRYRIGVDVGGM